MFGPWLRPCWPCYAGQIELRAWGKWSLASCESFIYFIHLYLSILHTKNESFWCKSLGGIPAISSAYLGTYLKRGSCPSCPNLQQKWTFTFSHNPRKYFGLFPWNKIWLSLRNETFLRDQIKKKVGKNRPASVKIDGFCHVGRSVLGIWGMYNCIPIYKKLMQLLHEISKTFLGEIIHTFYLFLIYDIMRKKYKTLN